MSTPALEIDGLGCDLGGTRVLENVCLIVPEGGAVAIIGPNGSGKTTLLKCLNRIVPHSAGRVRVFGRDLASYSQRDLARVLSYVPQADARYLPFRVHEFILMGRYPHLSPFSSISAADRAVADAAMDLTETAVFADRAVDTLSGGERQRVFIAAALTQGARILLLDEPTTFLDYKHQVDVHRLLRRLHRDEQVTVVSVTHDITSDALGADTVLALKAGRVHFDGSPEALLEGSVLEDLYETDFERVDVGSGRPVVRAVERKS